MGGGQNSRKYHHLREKGKKKPQRDRKDHQKMHFDILESMLLCKRRELCGATEQTCQMQTRCPVGEAKASGTGDKRSLLTLARESHHRGEGRK